MADAPLNAESYDTRWYGDRHPACFIYNERSEIKFVIERDTQDVNNSVIVRLYNVPPSIDERFIMQHSMMLFGSYDDFIGAGYYKDNRIRWDSYSIDNIYGIDRPVEFQEEILDIVRKKIEADLKFIGPPKAVSHDDYSQHFKF